MSATEIVNADDAYAHAGGGAEGLHRHMAAELAKVGRLGEAFAATDVPPATAGDEAVTDAFINDGRWLVTCPDCNESQIASRRDHRMLCFTCKNAGISGRWRPVKFPHNASAIESELATWGSDVHGKRMMRSWRAGESLAGLRKRKFDNLRPSIPRLEDLSPKQAAALEDAHNAYRHAMASGAKKLPLVPSVEWDDDERTVAIVRDHAKKLTVKR